MPPGSEEPGLRVFQPSYEAAKPERVVDQHKAKDMSTMSIADVQSRRTAPLQSPSGLGSGAIRDIAAACTTLLADVFVVYLKTKNFHWHMSGPHFRDYHLMLDEHADQIFAMTDDIAERARKLGGTTIRSIGDIAQHQRLKDNNAEFVAPIDMLTELRGDNL